MDQEFIDTQIKLRGKEKAQKWLDSLPETIKKYESKWSLKSLGAFPNLSINYVEKARTENGKEVVLKYGFLGDEEFQSEVKTLEIYNGEGCVKILNKNIDDCIILLERCLPGDPLHTLKNEEKEISVFAQVAKQIWSESFNSSEFKKLSGESKYFDWYLENLEKCKDTLPEDLVIKSQKIFRDLINSQGALYLLHADLHHDNILNSERGWLCIDPKGIIGERGYEPSVYIINPYKRFKDNESLISKDFFAKRIDLICEALDLDRDRVTAWAFIKQILSIIWSLQDFGTSDMISIKKARELERLL